MKKSKLILISIFLLGICYDSNSQINKKTQEKEISNDLRNKLKAEVEANPNSREAHIAFLETFKSPNDAEEQYQLWMQKFPTSVVVPLTLAEKFGSYNPKTREYLLKAALIDPKNKDVWEELAVDASMRGEKSKQEQYILKAIKADPEDLGLQINYIFLFNDDLDQYKKKVMEFVEKNPRAKETITLMHLFGYELKDLQEKIRVWELLQKMFPLQDIQVPMSRLADIYIQTGQYDKAINLSASMKNKASSRMNFEQKLIIAEKLRDIEAKLEEGKNTEAINLAMPLNIQSKNLFDVGNRVVLTKASALHASGSDISAYDTLIAFQAKTPDIIVQNALYRYGEKLGKNQNQVKEDILYKIKSASIPAIPFELKQYLTNEKINLNNLKGKVVLLSFWYPGCGPCRGEMPHIEAALKNFDRNRIVYLGVNGKREQDEFVKPFMKGTKFSFTPLASTKDMLKSYKIQYYPTNFIIDKEGNIAYSGFMVTPTSEKMLELMIKSLL